MTLTEFLLARIADRESMIHDLGDLAVRHTLSCTHPAGLDGATGVCDCGAIDRSLTECRAQRLVIDEIWTYEDRIEGEWGSSRSVAELQRHPAQPDALKAMALPDADHPDFDPAWRLS